LLLVLFPASNGFPPPPGTADAKGFALEEANGLAFFPGLFEEELAKGFAFFADPNVRVPRYSASMPGEREKFRGNVFHSASMPAGIFFQDFRGHFCFKKSRGFFPPIAKGTNLEI
jgi:hypothetical protein